MSEEELSDLLLGEEEEEKEEEEGSFLFVGVVCGVEEEGCGEC